MSPHRIVLSCLPCLLAIPLAAQPQIGGGTCSSATLSGTYSLTLSGRDLSSAVAFSTVLQGIGLATFDGQSKVSFILNNNTNMAFGVAQTLSGTYSLQSNCIGAVSITTGDTANFILGSWDSGTDFFVTGQDGVYSFLGSGNTQPTSACAASTLSGVYAFNGNGFVLASGVISGVNYLSGLLTFDGVGAVTAANWYVTANGASTLTTATAPGKFTVNSNCTATVTLTDSAANAYSLILTITSATGSNFILSGSSSKLMFSASGRTL
jgi:hypothetical protein